MGTFTDANMALEMRNRVHNLRKVCMDHKEGGNYDIKHNPRLLRHLIVNDKYKLIYCYIPKVACTNIMRVFLILSGKMNTTEPLDIKSSDVHTRYRQDLTHLSDLSYKEAAFRLKNYRKVLFVREPFERILSAFVNKFRGKFGSFKSSYGTEIIKYFRSEPNSEELTGEGVKFTEFIQFLNDPFMQIDGYNEHWAHYHKLCLPCHINYDFVGKYETLEEDVNTLLNISDVGDRVQFPRRSSTYKNTKTEAIYWKYYSSVPKRLLQHLWTTYQLDFELFGYPYPSLAGPFPNLTFLHSAN